jgi:hypothetical protein
VKLTRTNRPTTYTTNTTPPPGPVWQETLRPLCGPETTTTFHGTPHHNHTTSPCDPYPQISRPDPQGRRTRNKGYGGHSVGETPGPIPNPEAKTHSADGTAPGRVWESRTPPDNHSRKAPRTPGGLRAFNTQHTHPARRGCTVNPWTEFFRMRPLSRARRTPLRMCLRRWSAP